MKGLALFTLVFASSSALAGSFECSGNNGSAYITVSGTTAERTRDLASDLQVTVHIGADTSPILFPVAKDDVFQYLNDEDLFVIQALRDGRPLFLSLLFDRTLESGDVVLSADIDQEFAVPVECRFF